MPKNNAPIKLIRSVAADMGVHISNRAATKASAMLDHIEEQAELVPAIEAFLHLWSDPTGETASRNVDNERRLAA